MVDFHPDTLYAPVASHEKIPLVIAFAASQDYLVEGGDISNANLYGKIDVPVFMRQPMDSTGVEATPGKICELRQSIYGLRKAGNIWGSVVHQTLLKMGFQTSRYNSRLYLYPNETDFMMIAIVVDDMVFASHSHEHMLFVENKLKGEFNVSMFGSLKSFIGWDITRSSQGIKISQQTYIKSILESYGLRKVNPARIPLPVKNDLDPDRTNESTGFVFDINGETVYWKSKRQTITALSSGEAEYVALSTSAQQLCWFRCLFWEVFNCRPWSSGVSFPPTTLYVDSTAAQPIADGKDSKKTKHIDIKFHHVRDMIEFNIITLNDVKSADQPADIFTKTLDIEV